MRFTGHRRELLRAQKIQQDQKDENVKTGTVPMRIVLAKNEFINIPFQEVLQHVVHEQKELDILKKIDFDTNIQIFFEENLF